MSFIAELKRRKVFRVAVGYVVAAWLLIQVVETVFPAFGLDDESLNEEIILDIVCRHPKLLQRPIVVQGERAIIGRPPENVLELINP